MNKEELGNKIKAMRERKGFSRERFCGDESELTVRQLARIESGHSFPSISRLDYIHKKLGIPLSKIVDDNHVVLPKEYLALKLRFMKYNTYRNPQRMAIKESMLEEMHEKFYEVLPEEEQVIIDIYQATVDVNHSLNLLYGEPIIEEYFEQVKRKTQYNLVDLMVIRLYFIYLVDSTEVVYQPKLVKKFINTSAKYFDYGDVYMIEYGISFYIQCLTVMLFHRDYGQIEFVFKLVEELLNYNGDISDRSIYFMLQAKYSYFCKGDSVTADSYYEKAIMGAKFSENDTLQKRLKQEWKKDKKKFKLESST